MLISIIIMIGLSNISCDPQKAFENHFYERTILNSSNKTINVIYTGIDKIPISFLLEPKTQIAPNFSLVIYGDALENENLYLHLEKTLTFMTKMMIAT